MQNIFSYIDDKRNKFDNEDVPLFEGVDFSQYDTINQIDHYDSDKYMEEAYDDVIGDFPFDNISKFRVLLEARATDFDMKHIEVEPESPTKEDRLSALIATKAIRIRAEKIDLPQTLNDICYTRPKYGGVHLTKGADGYVSVTKWQNIINDQSDLMAGTRIIRHYLSPSELIAKSDVWKNTEDAIKTAEEIREKDIEEGGQEKAKTQGELIEVFELIGDVSKCLFDDAVARMNGDDYEYNKEDKYKFVQVRIYICGADWYDKDTKEAKGIVFYAEEEKNVDKYLARNPMAGRALGVGIYEDLFENQKWHNYTKTEEMRMIAIAGKKLYWSDDPEILANIFDEGVDHGTILRVGQGKTLSELNQLPTGTPIYSNIRAEYDESANRKTSSFNAKIGEESKAGTPFRAQYLQNLEATSQFEQYREEIGFLIKEVVEDWILPDALDDITKEDKIYTVFTPQELALIDEVIINKTVNQEIIERTKKRIVVSPVEAEAIALNVQAELRKNGNKRMLKEIKDFIKKTPGRVRVHTTDEARNKAVYFESLGNALALLAPEDPRRNPIIDRIMDAIGISKDELEMYMTEATPTAPNPRLQTDRLAQANQGTAEQALNG